MNCNKIGEDISLGKTFYGQDCDNDWNCCITTPLINCSKCAKEFRRGVYK